MEITSEFLLYAIIFRLAVIGAGVTCIVLGYRLFTQGLPRNSKAAQQSSIEARAGGAGFGLKNVAPGSAFAIFGAALISTMTIQGMPHLELKPGSTGTSDAITVRGNDPNTLGLLTLKGVEAERNGKPEDAIAAYEAALALLAEPSNNLAWLYNKTGKAEKALALAQLAVQLRPVEPKYLDTLATVLAATGRRDEAIKWMRAAVQLDPSFKGKLEELEKVAK